MAYTDRIASLDVRQYHHAANDAARMKEAREADPEKTARERIGTSKG